MRAVVERVEHVMGMPVRALVRDARAARRRGRRRVRLAALGRRDVQHLRRGQRDQPLGPRRAGAARRAPAGARRARPLRRGCAARPAARSTSASARARRPIRPGWSRAGRSSARARASSAAGARDFCLDAGGDVARPRRAVADRDPPPAPARPARGVLALRDGAVATSGAYERGEHVRRPAHRAAAARRARVTVVGPGPRHRRRLRDGGVRARAGGPGVDRGPGRLRRDDDRARRRRIGSSANVGEYRV